MSLSRIFRIVLSAFGHQQINYVHTKPTFPREAGKGNKQAQRATKKSQRKQRAKQLKNRR